MALTDARVRTLKPNGAADRLVADGNGLHIRLRSARGGVSRTWVFRRKTAGRMTVATLGTYPALSVRDARLKAAELATQGTLDNTTVQQAATSGLLSGSIRPSERRIKCAAMSSGQSFPRLANVGCEMSSPPRSPTPFEIIATAWPSSGDPEAAGAQRRGRCSRYSRAYSGMPWPTVGLPNRQPPN
jgi:hypothetical protein